MALEQNTQFMAFLHQVEKEIHMECPTLLGYKRHFLRTMDSQLKVVNPTKLDIKINKILYCPKAFNEIPILKLLLQEIQLYMFNNNTSDDLSYEITHDKSMILSVLKGICIEKKYKNDTIIHMVLSETMYIYTSINTITECVCYFKLDNFEHSDYTMKFAIQRDEKFNIEKNIPSSSLSALNIDQLSNMFQECQRILNLKTVNSNIKRITNILTEIDIIKAKNSGNVADIDKNMAQISELNVDSYENIMKAHNQMKKNPIFQYWNDMYTIIQYLKASPEKAEVLSILNIHQKVGSNTGIIQYLEQVLDITKVSKSAFEMNSELPSNIASIITMVKKVVDKGISPSLTYEFLEAYSSTLFESLNLNINKCYVNPNVIISYPNWCDANVINQRIFGKIQCYFDTYNECIDSSSNQFAIRLNNNEYEALQGNRDLNFIYILSTGDTIAKLDIDLQRRVDGFYLCLLWKKDITIEKNLWKTLKSLYDYDGNIKIFYPQFTDLMKKVQMRIKTNLVSLLQQKNVNLTNSIKENTNTIKRLSDEQQELERINNLVESSKEEIFKELNATLVQLKTKHLYIERPKQLEALITQLKGISADELTILNEFPEVNYNIIQFFESKLKEFVV